MIIDVIIPLYKPDRELFTLLERLNKQTVPVNRIFLLNTEEKYFSGLIYGTDFSTRFRNVEVHHLSRREFDHGGTRRMGVRKSNADIFVMMTQDAMPINEFLLENLIKPLEGKVAVSYARQMAGSDSSILEKFSRRFNYPEQSSVKSMKDVDRLGIKTFFCSNVCAAYRRDIYDLCGGFIKKAIFNEDMIYAATAMKLGYSVAYASDAQVLHSHNYNCRQQFRRNFDLGVSQAEHPEIFGDISSESEGGRMVKSATAYLRKNHMIMKIPYFYLQCAWKYAGYFLGKHYRLLPMSVVKKCTSNTVYWK